MRSILPALFLSGLLLAGCGNGNDSYSKSYDVMEERMMASPPPPPQPTPVPDGQRFSKVDSGSGALDDLPQRAGLFLAYTYSRNIEVPAAGLKDLLEEHAKACQDAGPKNCLVTNSNVNGLGTEYASGYLNLKAAPDWALPFLDGLASNVEGKGASVKDASKTSTDLTAQIIDTDARLTAQKTLRDRLQKLLETRDGNLEELLGVERELARVQAEIDSYQAVLANLRQRVAMSDINIRYTAKMSPVSSSVWRPLSDAFGDFFSNIAYALAGIVNLLPFLIIWIPLIGGLVWLAVFVIRRLIRKTKAHSGRKDTASSTESA